MADKAYRHTTTGVVIAVAEDSALEEAVTASGFYEAAELDDLASDAPALAVGAASVAERQERNGWLTPPGVAPVAITGASRATADGEEDPVAKLLGGTTEEVNTYLDEHPGDAATVLAAEAAGKNRKGIVEGRHKATVEPPAAPPASE